jgi:hypothetical protein
MYGFINSSFRLSYKMYWKRKKQEGSRSMASYESIIASKLDKERLRGMMGAMGLHDKLRQAQHA